MASNCSVGDLKAGQSVVWQCGPTVYGADGTAMDSIQYGLVVAAGGGRVGIIGVDAVDRNFTRFYDSVDADPDKDKDNVQLKDCPPPFTELCILSETYRNEDYDVDGAIEGRVPIAPGGAYAIARFSGESLHVFDQADLDRLGVEMADPDHPVSDRDMRAVMSHDVDSVLQREFPDSDATRPKVGPTMSAAFGQAVPDWRSFSQANQSSADQAGHRPVRQQQAAKPSFGRIRGDGSDRGAMAMAALGSVASGTLAGAGVTGPDGPDGPF